MGTARWRSAEPRRGSSNSSSSWYTYFLPFGYLEKAPLAFSLLKLYHAFLRLSTTFFNLFFVGRRRSTTAAAPPATSSFQSALSLLTILLLHDTTTTSSTFLQLHNSYTTTTLYCDKVFILKKR